MSPWDREKLLIAARCKAGLKVDEPSVIDGWLLAKYDPATDRFKVKPGCGPEASTGGGAASSTSPPVPIPKEDPGELPIVVEAEDITPKKKGPAKRRPAAALAPRPKATGFKPGKVYHVDGTEQEDVEEELAEMRRNGMSERHIDAYVRAMAESSGDSSSGSTC